MIDDHDGNIIIMIELSRSVGLTHNSTPPWGKKRNISVAPKRQRLDLAVVVGRLIKNNHFLDYKKASLSTKLRGLLRLKSDHEARMRRDKKVRWSTWEIVKESELPATFQR